MRTIPRTGAEPGVWRFARHRRHFAGGNLPGDYDGNGAVEQADYAVWRSTFSIGVAAFTSADGNGDGQIDAADYSVWRDNLGSVLAGAAAGGFDSLAGSVAVSAAEMPTSPESAAANSQVGKRLPHYFDAAISGLFGSAPLLGQRPEWAHAHRLSNVARHFEDALSSVARKPPRHQPEPMEGSDSAEFSAAEDDTRDRREVLANLGHEF